MTFLIFHPKTCPTSLHCLGNQLILSLINASPSSLITIFPFPLPFFLGLNVSLFAETLVTPLMTRYQALLDDPTFTPIGNRSRNDSKDRRTFFSNTLWTESTIRASQCFYKGHIPPERWGGPPRPLEAQQGPGECRMVFSLGDGVSGGMKYAESSHI